MIKRKQKKPNMRKKTFWTKGIIIIALIVVATISIQIATIGLTQAARYGFRAWSIQAYDDGEMTTPSRRKQWWWIFLSFTTLTDGFLIG